MADKYIKVEDQTMRCVISYPNEPPKGEVYMVLPSRGMAKTDLLTRQLYRIAADYEDENKES